MGLGDFLWPFERKFSQVPCAREAGIAAVIGGPCIGAIVQVLNNNVVKTWNAVGISGFIIFWVAFIKCRVEQDRTKRIAREWQEAKSFKEIK